jgi:hypothetical protein
MIGAMIVGRHLSPGWIVLAAFPLAAATTSARADERAAPVIHPIYAHLPGSGHNDEAHRLFSEAAARYRLGPVEVMDIPGPAAPRAPELLKSGTAALLKIRFAEAEPALDAAVAEVTSSGGAGLGRPALADLFVAHAMAAQKATWKELGGPLAAIEPAKAREAYLRAAVLAPDRELEPSRFPPVAIASLRLAVAEVAKRPRGTVVVKATPSAEISIDGGPTLLSPASAPTLPYGEHFVRVEDVGHQPWGATVILTEPVLTIDAPATAPLTPDDSQAAARARRQGARFALVATLETGPTVRLELALVDAATGFRRDSSVIPFAAAGEAGALDAAVMRLDEEARRVDLSGSPRTVAVPSADSQIGTVPLAPPTPGAPRFADEPGRWARAHWPLLTAIGAAVGTALVLGIAVAADTRPPR